MNVKISEIFSSVQGEGRWAGHPAVFVRFAGCSNNCWFCDTKYAQSTPASGQLQRDNLHTYSITRNINNWTEVPIQEVYEYVVDLIEQSSQEKAKRIQMVVITGGEPFEQPEALGELCVKLPYLAHEKHGITNHLQVCIESSGTVPVQEGGPYAGGMEEPPVYITIAGNVLNYIASSVNCFLTISPKPKPPQIEYIDAASQLKFLVGHTSEFDSVIPIEVFKHVTERTEGITFQPIWTDDPEQRATAIQRAIKKAFTHGGTVSTQIHKFLDIQ